jgi:hypothetical protein
MVDECYECENIAPSSAWFIIELMS